MIIITNATELPIIPNEEFMINAVNICLFWFLITHYRILTFLKLFPYMHYFDVQKRRVKKRRCHVWKIGRRCKNCATHLHLVAISHILKTSGLLPIKRAFLLYFMVFFVSNRLDFAFSLILSVKHLRLVVILYKKNVWSMPKYLIIVIPN